jgi:PD-(D/E)XK nuclease superfamily
VGGLTISNSMVKTYQRCQLQYLYKFEDMLAPNHSELPLKRGLWMHELLAVHYTGGDWLKHHKSLTKKFNKLFEEERERYGDLPDHCYRLMKGYLLKWKKEDEKFDVLATEQEFDVKLPHGHRLKFRVDLIIEDEWGIWLVEHKTHKSLPHGDYRFLDVQTTRYLWGLGQEGINCTGVLWNYIRTRPPTRPKLLKRGGLSNARRNIDTELYTFLRTLDELGLPRSDYRDKIKALRRSDNYFRRERVPRGKPVVEQLVREAVAVADQIERGVLPIRSVERSCEWMCSYKDLCISDLYGGNTKALVKSKYHVREPGEYYADALEGEEGYGSD